jgi:dTDP-4-amino-4,6-dideoxygalactose transaminase
VEDFETQSSKPIILTHLTAPTGADGRVAVPFADLTRSVTALRPELERAIQEVLASGWFVLGGRGEAFEREFAAYCGAGHTVGVANGTDAIEVALRALGVGPGDEVVTQANTCVPTVAGIARTGATPVLCDVEPEGGTIDPASLAVAVGPRTRAIVPVHLYGQCAEMDAVREVAGHAIPVIEDCAQAHGAEYDGDRAGTLGTAGAFSFYPTKNLGAIGDAGAIVTGDGELAERLRLVRQYGQTDRYHHEIEGVNSRLDEVQAAILSVKLGHLDAGNERRRQIAAAYTDALEGTPVRHLAALPRRLHAYHLYVVRAPDRERFQAELDRRGVATLVHYPLPVHKQPPYVQLADGPVPLTVSEQLAGEVVSLPLYPEMTEEEVDAVAAAARESAGATG